MSDPPDGIDRDPYQALGVDADATDEEITRAYRRLARTHHPDTNPDAADAAFTGITDAYDILRDPDRRKRYDQTGATDARAARPAPGTRIPVHNLGQPGQRPRRPPEPRAQDPVVEFFVSFEHAAVGTTATLAISTDQPCTACRGSGVAMAPGRCQICRGRGMTSRDAAGITIRTSCSHCDGTGQQPPTRCPTCAGDGTTRVITDVAVPVPAGVEDGTRLRVPTVPRHVGAVDAIVRVAAHPYFGRRGLDLTLRLPITLAEAALGVTVTVPTLHQAVTMRVPPGTPHGRVLRVAGRGINDGVQVGDLLITIAIVVPAELNDRQRTALEAFAAATPSPRDQFPAAPTELRRSAQEQGEP